MNHRSEEFMKMVERTTILLKDRLDIPEGYTVFYTSSATECWEIIAQSLVVKESVHVFNGSFGEKWYDYTRKLKPDAKARPFDCQSELNPDDLDFSGAELICVTQNETSNGTQLSHDIMGALRRKNPKVLIAADATSSMAGIALDFSQADCWFASVQKCFGLPAGLAVMVCSPAAIARMGSIAERQHYNSMTVLKEMMDKWQTPCTPNVLAIYLLMRVLKKSKSIDRVSEKLEVRSAAWARFFGGSKRLSLLISNPAVRSGTVIAVKADEALVTKVKADARRHGFLLGEGYGALKKETFRIANFPALKRKEVQKLMRFLIPYL